MSQGHEKDDTTGEGQVSEMVPEGDEPDAISAGDPVAAQPGDESGETQEGAQGPNAVPTDPTGKHPHDS